MNVPIMVLTWAWNVCSYIPSPRVIPRFPLRRHELNRAPRHSFVFLGTEHLRRASGATAARGLHFVDPDKEIISTQLGAWQGVVGFGGVWWGVACLVWPTVILCAPR